MTSGTTCPRSRARTAIFIYFLWHPYNSILQKSLLIFTLVFSLIQNDVIQIHFNGSDSKDALWSEMNQNQFYSSEHCYWVRAFTAIFIFHILSPSVAAAEDNDTPQKWNFSSPGELYPGKTRLVEPLDYSLVKKLAMNFCTKYNRDMKHLKL